MRARSLGMLALLAIVSVARIEAACSSPPPPGEKVVTSSGPPITLCYEPDGALCPLDAGEDAGDAEEPIDADAGATPIADACGSDAGC
jgi:hypothetical protein